MSTPMFAEYVHQIKGKLHSCDISENNIKNSKKFTQKFKKNVNYYCEDSLKFLLRIHLSNSGAFTTKLVNSVPVRVKFLTLGGIVAFSDESIRGPPALKELTFDQIVYYDTHEQEREKREFWEHLELEMDGWGTNDMNDNERKVYEAIRILLNSVEEIEIFNKKAIYLYLREITGMNTKQIVTQLNKFRKKYRLFKDDWDNVNI